MQTQFEAIKSQPIVDTIGNLIQLKRHGTDFICCCPFHNENTPSFHVSNSKGIYKCFGCGRSGDAIDFVKEFRNVDHKTAIEIISGEKFSTAGIKQQKSKPETKKPFLIPEQRLPNRYSGEFKTATLCRFFCSLFPDHPCEVDSILKAYGLMTRGNGINIFPYRDTNGRIRQVKELKADELTGKRSREITPLFNGKALMSEQEQQEERLKPCFFGEHLIDDGNAIAITEGEKTAIGMSITEKIFGGNGFTWIATGGKYGASLKDPNTIEVLRGKQVYIFPDNDAVEDWRQFMQPISKIAQQVFYIDSIAKAENNTGKEKYDIWDYTLDELRKDSTPILNPLLECAEMLLSAAYDKKEDITIVNARVIAKAKEAGIKLSDIIKQTLRIEDQRYRQGLAPQI